MYVWCNEVVSDFQGALPERIVGSRVIAYACHGFGYVQVLRPKKLMPTLDFLPGLGASARIRFSSEYSNVNIT